MRKAFTLIELLVVITIIAIVAAMMLPSLSKAKLKAQGIQCISNQKQLSTAWRMYSEDCAEKLPHAASFAPPSPEAGSYPWCAGGLDYRADNQANWDIETSVKAGLLWPYTKSAEIYKCPGDKSTVVAADGISKPHVRSFCLNAFVGAVTFDSAIGGADGSDQGDWRVFKKSAEIVNPSQIFTFLDTSESSFRFACFFIAMSGYPDYPEQQFYYALPGSYHNKGAKVSFVDGHSESHKWRDERTIPQIQSGVLIPTFSCPRNQDITWLQAHATVHQ